MATAWIDSVKKGKVLTLFTGSSASSWAPIVTEAIKRFNALSAQLSCGLTFDATTTPPDPTSNAGADVSFQLASGQFSFSWNGAKASGPLSGTGLEARTQTVAMDFGSGAQVVKAFIFCPSTPMDSANKRQVSNKIKMLILMHEMVHATGLDNKDHSPETNPDLFCANPQYSSGNKDPTQDSLIVGSTSDLTNRKIMPPVFMTQATAGKIAALW